MPSRLRMNYWLRNSYPLHYISKREIFLVTCHSIEVGDNNGFSLLCRAHYVQLGAVKDGIGYIMVILIETRPNGMKKESERERAV